MVNILIVGFGNLGKRYYEAISQIKHFVINNTNQPNNIYIYDPFINTDVEGATILNSLCTRIVIDLAIISTCADVRFSVTEELIENNTVINIIFEKFLFLYEDDYTNMDVLLKKNYINAWVNCTRRLYEPYRYIYKKLITDIRMVVVGDKWDLCSNGIHYLDLYNYLDPGIKIGNLKMIDGEIIDSKRPGFKSMTGTIVSSNGNFRLVCNKNNGNIITKKIWNSEYEFVLINCNNQLNIIEHNKNNDSYKTMVYDIPFLSEISKEFITNIIENKEVNLPTFADSIEPHKQLLKLFTDEFIKKDITVNFT